MVTNEGNPRWFIEENPCNAIINQNSSFVNLGKIKVMSDVTDSRPRI